MKQLIKLSKAFGNFSDMGSWEHHVAFHNSEWAELYSWSEWLEWRRVLDLKICQMKRAEEKRKLDSLNNTTCEGKA